MYFSKLNLVKILKKSEVIAAFSLISNISGINDPTKRNMINILKMHESD